MTDFVASKFRGKSAALNFENAEMIARSYLIAGTAEYDLAIDETGRTSRSRLESARNLLKCMFVSRPPRELVDLQIEQHLMMGLVYRGKDSYQRLSSTAYNKSTSHFRKALQISKKIGYSAQEMDASFNLAVTFIRQAKYQTAQLNLLNVLARFEYLWDEDSMARAMTALADSIQRSIRPPIIQIRTAAMLREMSVNIRRRRNMFRADKEHAKLEKLQSQLGSSGLSRQNFTIAPSQLAKANRHSRKLAETVQRIYERLFVIKWRKYKGLADEIDLEDEISRRIVEKLGRNLNEFFKNTDGARTTRVMDALSELGKELHFRSMSNRISPETQQPIGEFKKAEWLYDLHWYEEELPSRYQQTSMVLAVECEWGYKRRGDKNDDDYSAVKWDFQKLLVTNADLRLMIFKRRIERGNPKVRKVNEDLDKYFSETIKGYRNLTPGSSFLFVAFCDENKDQLQYAFKVK